MMSEDWGYWEGAEEEHSAPKDRPPESIPDSVPAELDGTSAPECRDREDEALQPEAWPDASDWEPEGEEWPDEETEDAGRFESPAECPGPPTVESPALPSRAGVPRGRLGWNGQRQSRFVKPDEVRLAFSFPERLLILDTWQRSGLPARDFA